MNATIRQTARWTVGSAAVAMAAYAAYAGVTWARYGSRRKPTRAEEADLLLDRFMPDYEVAERHCIRVAAPAHITYNAACEMDLGSSAIIRAIFRARELVLGAKPTDSPDLHGIIAYTKALGWGVLSEIPGREIVMGAVTRPWNANVVFRALPPDEFARFNEPGYVKIAWTLRADPSGTGRSIHRTETRVSTTSTDARARFRPYWAVFSPGIILIRRIGIRLVKREAERIGGQQASEVSARGHAVSL